MLADIGDGFAIFGNLLGRCDFEFCGVRLTIWGPCYLCLFRRLGDVYETKGESVKSSHCLKGAVLK